MSIEQGFQISELYRRLNNLLRIGKVVNVNYAIAKARVKIGGITTDFLPWLTPSTGTWTPLKNGEQVIVLSPNGDLLSGIILPALYQTAKPAPANTKDKHKIIFEDGSVVECDTASKTISVDAKGDLNVSVTGSATISAQTANLDASAVNITASTTTISGDVSIGGAATIAGAATIGAVSTAAGKVIACFSDPVSVSGTTHKGTIG